MKHIATFILVFSALLSTAQDANNTQLLAFKKANNYIYEGNVLAEKDDFIAAEMEYRKAISKQASNMAGTYNLGNSYYSKGNFNEALYRHQQAAESANTKPEKHLAYHNIGNALMQSKQFAEAVEAYKQALRNDPTDDETRYNLALAKKKQKEQEDKQDKNKDDKNKDKKDKDNKDDKENQDKKENDDKKDKEGDNKDDKENQDKKEDEEKPKDKKDDKGKSDKEKEKEQPKPKQGQLSPQQIKNLLEAMNNQEKEVQEKMNAEKQKGVKIKTEKDW